MFDRGTGPPLVVVPGLHGRWEWSKPALCRMAQRCRTISYSLCGDLGSGVRFDRALGFENYVRQLDAIIDRSGLERFALCGVSFGGLVAVSYAARRPERVSALVLASTPGPGFEPSEQQARWLAKPWRSAPIFVLTSPLRIWPELRRALPGRRQRAGFVVRQTLRCAAAPMVPSLMATRMRGLSAVDFAATCRAVSAPTLVLSGEEGLDRVVPVASTRVYATAIHGAHYHVLAGTGHMGSLTQPDRFAAIVTDFVHANHS